MVRKVKKHNSAIKKQIAIFSISILSIANMACSVNPSAKLGNSNASVNISKAGVSANIGTYYNLQF